MSLTSSFGVGCINMGNGMHDNLRQFQLPEDIKLLKRNFLSSEIIHLLRTANLKADSLARSARKQPSFVVHMNAELPI
uniref:RNase H type-1 domain-containing protein n=1 Tax=Brassica oleracea var. oleracea TaxID=109376 RepID=A0A0D3BVH2_BRAOL